MGRFPSWTPGVEPAPRRQSPHVIPREPPTTVRRVPAASSLPPPLDTPPPEAIGSPGLQPWPTSLLTLPVPIYQPLGAPAAAAAKPKSGVRRTDRRPFWLVTAVLVASLTLAFWQLYWLLDSSPGGREIVDRVAGTIASVTDLF